MQIRLELDKSIYYLEICYLIYYFLIKLDKLNLFNFDEINKQWKNKGYNKKNFRLIALPM